MLEIKIGEIVVEDEIEIGEIELDVEKIYPALEDLEVIPKEVEQNFKPTEYGFGSVKVNPVKLQDKIIVPTKVKQEIKADEEYDGLNKVNVEAIPDEYIIPSGTLNITDNGEYNVADKTIAIVNVSEKSSEYPIIEGNGQFEVEFVDYDGTLLKKHYVNKGEDAIAPELPEHDRLLFHGWNREFTNITHNTQVGAIYVPQSGNSELYIEITEETGLTVTLTLSSTGSATKFTIDWGDGIITETNSFTGAKVMEHTYSSYGEYMIEIIASQKYALGASGSSYNKTAIKGSNEVEIFKLLKKAFLSQNVLEVISKALMNNVNLEQFVAPGVEEYGANAFMMTKLKCLILPETTLTIGDKFATFNYDLEYLVMNDNVTKITYPIYSGGKVKKLIYPKNYKPTSIGRLAYDTSVEEIWYAKPETNHEFASSAIYHSLNIRRLPLYNTLTTINSSSITYSGIDRLYLPPSLTDMKSNALYQNGSLTNVYCYAHTPPTLASTNVFNNANSNLKIHVYPEDLEAYLAATNWSSTSISSKLVGDLEGEYEDGYC